MFGELIESLVALAVIGGAAYLVYYMIKNRKKD